MAALVIIGALIAGLSISIVPMGSLNLALILIGAMVMGLVLLQPFLGVVILLIVLWLTPFYSPNGGITLNRIVGLFVLAGIVVRILSRREKLTFIFSSFDYGLIYFVIISLLSVIINMINFNHDFPVDRYIDLGMSYLLYWFIIRTVDNWKKLQTLFFVTIGCAVVVCMPTILMGIRADPNTVQRISIEGSPNFYASLFLLAILLLMWLSDHFPAPQKYVLFFLMMVLIVGIFFTGNRSSLMSLGVVFLFYFLMARGIGIRYFIPVGLAVVIGFWVASQYVPVLVSRSTQYLPQETILANDAVRMRIYNGALRVFLDHPLLGVGSGNATDYIKMYTGLRVSTHNLFLGVAVETGVLGLAGLLSMYYFVFRDLLKAWYFSWQGNLESWNNAIVRTNAFHAVILIIGFNIIQNLTHGLTIERPWFVIFAFVIVFIRLFLAAGTGVKENSQPQKLLRTIN